MSHEPTDTAEPTTQDQMDFWLAANSFAAGVIFSLVSHAAWMLVAEAAGF